MGDRFPDLSLPTSEGEQFELRFPRERGAVVVCYRGAWCPFCLTELRELDQHYEALLSRDVDVIAVSVDEPEVTRVLRKRLGLDITFLSDTRGFLMDLLGIRDEDGLFIGVDHTPLAPGRESRDIYMPTTFVLDPDGIVRWVHRTESYRVRPAGSDVVQAVDVMQATATVGV